MDCPYCKMPYMEWRMDETTAKSKLWDTNLGLWHDCKESPQAKKKKADQEWKNKREKILLEERKKKIIKLKTPIFCLACQKSYKPNQPCKHMIDDGFELGVDGSDFYSDTPKAIARREQIKAKKKRESKKKSQLENFF